MRETIPEFRKLIKIRKKTNCKRSKMKLHIPFVKRQSETLAPRIKQFLGSRYQITVPTSIFSLYEANKLPRSSSK